MHMIPLTAIGTAQPWEIAVSAVMFFGAFVLIGVAAYLVSKR